MGRVPCCEKMGLKKGPWTPEEDQKLLSYIDRHGDGSWHALPAKAGLQRCGKSCRLRWINYLKPDIKRGKFSLQEEETMIQLHALLGNRWSVIAAYLPKRTDNEIKNYWNTHVKKRLTKMGIDHVTHKPKSGTAASGSSGWSLSHMTQWETARLEAEARLVRQSKLQLATTTSYKPQQHDSSYLGTPTPSTIVAPWQALLEANNNSYMNDAMLEGGASIFQNPSGNVLVDHHHHHHGDHYCRDNHIQYHEKDVLSSICNDGGGAMVNSKVSEQDIIGNASSGSESDHHNGVGCGFGYGGNFENNNVITRYWDDNIMSMVDASAFPFDDAPFLL